MRWALFVLAVIAAGYALGTFVYVAASYLLSRAHAERRPLAAALREVFREAVWALLTQPLLPLFYLVGRKLAHGDGRPVVFVHGYFQNRINFLYLARALGKRNMGPLYGFNYMWIQDLPTIARSLGAFVDEVRAETGKPDVDLVCHSMGGLVAAQYLAHEGGRDKVRRCVTIATPHKGVAYKGPIIGRARAALRKGHGIERLPELPILSVYSTHDNVVFPPTSSHLAEGQNVVLSGIGHLAILFVPATADAVATFLQAADAPREAVAVPVEASA